MKKFLLMIISSLIVSSIMSYPAMAKHDDNPPKHGDDESYMNEGKGHRGHMHGGMCFGDAEDMKEKFGLSDDQIKKIEEINVKYQKQLIEKREQMQPKKKKLKMLLLEEKINLTEVETLLRDISNIEVDIRLVRIKQRIEIEDLLTEKQKEKMKRKMKKERKEHKEKDKHD